MECEVEAGYVYYLNCAALLAAKLSTNSCVHVVHVDSFLHTCGTNAISLCRSRIWSASACRTRNTLRFMLKQQPLPRSSSSRCEAAEPGMYDPCDAHCPASRPSCWVFVDMPHLKFHHVHGSATAGFSLYIPWLGASVRVLKVKFK